jgi:hypothetical protein
MHNDIEDTIIEVLPSQNVPESISVLEEQSQAHVETPVNSESNVAFTIDNLDLDSVIKWVQRNIFIIFTLLIYFLLSHVEGKNKAL